MAGWSPDIYVCVSDVELWIYIAEYGLVGLDNSLKVDIDEEIVRIDMLFDETFHLQECRKKVPFVLDMVRPVESALSFSQVMGKTLFEKIELVSLQPDIQFRGWLRATSTILDKSFLLSFTRSLRA